MASYEYREEGGYDCQLVGDVEKNVHCTFCLQIFKDPYVLSCCQNHFCRPCIEKLRREGVRTCPICRKAHSPQLRAAPSRAMKDFVEALWVCCRHRESGCPWNGELRFFSQHLDPSLPIPNAGCPFHEVACSYRCGRRMPRWQTQQHQMDQCPKRPLLLRLGELERAMATKLKVTDGGGGQESQKKRDGDVQRQLTSVKKQLREEMEAYKEQVTADCLRLREKITAQEAKLRDLKPKTDLFREDVEQLRGEMHSMKHQLSSGTSQPEPVKVTQHAQSCACPKLKDEVYQITGDLYQEFEQLRQEFSSVKTRMAAIAASERAHMKARPSSPTANIKQELDQMRRHIDLEIEKSRQEMLQERHYLYRERLELEQRLASFQPRRIPEGIMSNSSLPPVVIFQKDTWGVYEFQDLWTVLRKSQQRYVMVEVS